MDTVRDSVTKKGPGITDLSPSVEGLVGGSYLLSADSGSSGGERGTVPSHPG